MRLELEAEHAAGVALVQVELIADLMVEFGMVDEIPPVEDAVYQ